MTLGSIGTGNETTVRLEEEVTFGAAPTTAVDIWLRKNRAFFQKIPNIVSSDYANATELGFAKTVFHTVAGLLAFEMDTTTIGWLLKWIMGNKVTAQQGGTSEYKHTFKFGTSLRSCYVYTDKGGLSSALNVDYKGCAIDRLGFIVNLFETVKCESVFVGKTDDPTGTAPGTPSYPSENLTVAYGGVKWYTGAAGLTTIAAMTQWTDPYDMRLEIARNRKADNFISDGTGATAGITDGVPSISCNLMAQLTSNHEYQNFSGDTERSFACRLDTGLAIPSGNGSNYMLDIVMPRVKFRAYNINADGIGTILPAIDIIPLIDPTALYSIRLDLFNNTTAYTDAV